MRSLTSTQTIIRDVLIYCARRRCAITYGDLAEIAGKRPRGPWSTDFDAIRKAEIESGRPDLTWLVVSETAGLPRTYTGKRFDPKDEERIGLYRNDCERVYEFWARDARSTGSEELQPAVDIAMETGRRPCSAADRQEREDQDFVDAVTDWDWDDE